MMPSSPAPFTHTFVQIINIYTQYFSQKTLMNSLSPAKDNEPTLLLLVITFPCVPCSFTAMELPLMILTILSWFLFLYLVFF